MRIKIDDIYSDLGFCLMMVVLTPLLIFTVHVSQSYFAGERESILRIGISGCLGIALTTFFGRRLMTHLSNLKKYTLGLEGELATGEELNQLMLDGCRVFHDVPMDYGNIDHVVVSQSGVFSVNSKMRGKPKNGNGKAELTVDYDRGVVRFPDFDYRIPVEQLETETKWLSQTLTSSVGRLIKVESILALPGWFLKERIGRGAVCVINPRNATKFFVQSRVVLSPELVQQVAHQLEQLCRDVEPSFRTKRERWEVKS